MRKFIGKLLNKSSIFPLTVFFIWIYLIAVNNIPNAWLSGWDTLHPEFNFSLNFQRLIFGVFREEQGLGAVAAHSHMADIPRVILLYISSILLPEYLLRFSFIASNLLIGVLGVYFFLKNTALEKVKESLKAHSALLGALFYLLNLGTLQHFYVPFEMFTVQFAFLPWLFLTLFNYLKNATKKNLAIFSVITLLSTPMAYTPTLWYVYFLSLLFTLVFFIKKDLKKVLTIIIVTLIINSFWILPNFYFLLSGNAANVPEAKINKLFSEEAFSYNRSFGNIQSTLIFKNFLFDWAVYQGSDRFGYLLEDWKQHLDNIWVLVIGYSLSIVVITGLIISILKRSLKVYYFLPTTIIAFIFLINQNPPFEAFFSFLRDSSNIFKEALRFPFTKFSIVLIFNFSLYFGLANSVILNCLSRLRGFKIIYVYTFLIALLLILFMLPAFKGDLISKKMFVKIPQEYFEMFDWFNSQPNKGRVAMLPIHSFWGWAYYDWGFQGSGFLSYGIKQPLLDRDFDRWNPANEQYYREMSYAIYSKDVQLLNKVITKYKIKYILLDENILAPGMNLNKGVLYLNEIKSILGQSSNFKLVKQFKKISVYEANSKYGVNFISSPEKFVSLFGKEGFKDIDWAYSRYGDYIQNGNTQSFQLVAYPFRSIIDNQNFLNQELIILNKGSISLIPKSLPASANFSPDSLLSDENSLPAEISFIKTKEGILGKLKANFPNIGDNQKEENYLSFDLPLQLGDKFLVHLDNNQYLNVELTNSLKEHGTFLLSTKSGNQLSFYKKFNTIEFNNNSLNYSIDLCGSPRGDQSFRSSISGNNSLALHAKNAQACVKIPFFSFIKESELTSYKTLINIKFSVETEENSFGHYCIFDNNLNRCINEKRFISSGSEINEYLTLEPFDLGNLQLIFFADAQNSNQEKRFIYKNFNISKSIPVAFYSLSTNDFINDSSNTKFLVTNNDVINLPISSSQTPDLQSLLREKNNPTTCNDLLPLSFNRNVNEKEGYIEYSSKKGSSCDYFEFPHLAHNLGYLFVIKSENISGQHLRICVANNQTYRCDVYVSPPRINNNKQNILVIPPSNDNGSGYNIHIDNVSFGDEPSVNRLKEIKIIPFPYNWITQLNFANNSNSAESGLIVNEVKQVLPFIYKVSYNNENNDFALLNLNQSFDKGWEMLGKKLVKVNGWSSGWMINPNEKGVSYIFFFPEILELAGFLILAIFFLSFVNLKKLRFFLNH